MYTKLFNLFYLVVIIVITKTLVINTALFLLRENVFVNFVSFCARARARACVCVCAWLPMGWQADASFRFLISLFTLRSFIP